MALVRWVCNCYKFSIGINTKLHGTILLEGKATNIVIFMSVFKSREGICPEDMSGLNAKLYHR